MRRCGGEKEEEKGGRRGAVPEDAADEVAVRACVCECVVVVVLGGWLRWWFCARCLHTSVCFFARSRHRVGRAVPTVVLTAAG